MPIFRLFYLYQLQPPYLDKSGIFWILWRDDQGTGGYLKNGGTIILPRFIGDKSSREMPPLDKANLHINPIAPYRLRVVLYMAKSAINLVFGFPSWRWKKCSERAFIFWPPRTLCMLRDPALYETIRRYIHTTPVKNRVFLKSIEKGIKCRSSQKVYFCYINTLRITGVPTGAMPHHLSQPFEI